MPPSNWRCRENKRRGQLFSVNTFTSHQCSTWKIQLETAFHLTFWETMFPSHPSRPLWKQSWWDVFLHACMHALHCIPVSAESELTMEVYCMQLIVSNPTTIQPRTEIARFNCFFRRAPSLMMFRKSSRSKLSFQCRGAGCLWRSPVGCVFCCRERIYPETWNFLFIAFYFERKLQESSSPHIF